MKAKPTLDPKLLPDPQIVDFRDVLMRPKKRAKPRFVQIPVPLIPKLRALGMGSFCTYCAVVFECAVQKETEVKVPARTWRMFGCGPGRRYRHVESLVRAGLIARTQRGSGKADLFRLTNPVTSFTSEEAPPTK